MNTETLIVIAATAATALATIIAVRATATNRPKVSLALKRITVTLVLAGLAGTVITEPTFYAANPALAVYMAAPLILGVLWTLHRTEAANPGRITGLITRLVNPRARNRPRRQPRVVTKFSTALRGWITLAIFEDNTPWRIAHIAAIATGFGAAALAPDPFNWVAPWCLVAISTLRWAKVQGVRDKTIQRIYAIAASHLDYTKAIGSRITNDGARFAHAAGCISVEWQDLTTPARILVSFPVTFAKTDMAKRGIFETEFDATLPGAGWKFDWDTTATTVTITVAHYPDNVRWEGRTSEHWGTFYIGDKLDDGTPVQFNVESESPHVLVAGETGSGKLVELSTKILTPKGWRRFGDIHPGDEVFAPDGTPVKVVFETVPDYFDEYEVVFSDGATVLVSDDHLWYTETHDTRKGRSKQEGDYRGAQRRPLLDPDVVDRLRQDAQRASPHDAVTATDAAMLAGINETTTWFRTVLSQLEPVGKVHEVRDFTRAAQEVTQTQTVLRYPAQEALEVARSWSIKGKARERLDSLAADNDLTTVTAAELSALVDLPVKTVHRLMWGSGVPATKSREEVVLTAPAKTVSRKGRTARAYRKAELFLALADAGEAHAHDQHDSMTKGAVRTTKQIRETLLAPDGALNHSIPVTRPLQFPEAANLPVAPYTLGVWLGDGLSHTGAFCGIDHQIARRVEAEGYTLRERTQKSPPGWPERHPDYRIWRVEGLTGALCDLGLIKRRKSDEKTKHIPQEYLRASEQQRRALLAGLLDTDGTVGPSGQTQFTSTTESLARGVHELALGLGYQATCVEGRATVGGEDRGPKWTVSFMTNDEVFGLDRKNEALRERTKGFTPEKNNQRYIVDVRPTGRKSLMKCIQVDSEDHLYLIGEHLIPTHNTEAMFVIAAQALSKGWQVAICDPKETGWAMWSRRRRFTNAHGEDTGAERLRDGDARPGVIEHAVEVYGIRDVLVRMRREMDRRKKVNADNKVVKWTELPDDVRKEHNIVPLLVVVDEALSLFDAMRGNNEEIREQNDVRAEALSSLQRLVVEARALGIHVLLGIQRPDASVLGGAMRSNLGARIACGVMEPSGYGMMFQTQGATPRLVTSDSEGKKVIGRALVRPSPGMPILPLQLAWLGPGQQDLDVVAPMPDPPEQEDETPDGAFNPYLRFDNPQEWLDQQFGAQSPPPWEQSSVELTEGAFDRVDQTGTAQVAQGAPWEADAEAIGDAVDHGLGELRLDTVAEALPGMPETPGAPAPADQPPPWEQPETDPLDDFDDEPDIEELGAMLGEVMSEMGIDGGAELGALEPWVTPAPAWNFDDTAQSPDLKEDTQPAPDEGADEALNPWFESFLADPDTPASNRDVQTPVSQAGTGPTVDDDADEWWE